MDSTAVATPVWLPHLPSHELAFLKITESHIGNSPRFLLAPDTLDATYYEHEFPDWRILRFPTAHFSNTQTYSQWLTTPDFYKAWHSFEFLMISQTDAVVIKPPDMQQFRNVDYVGAPWSPPIRAINVGDRLSIASRNGAWSGPWATRYLGRAIHVGNGGLSLRRVDKFTRMAEDLQSPPLQRLTPRFQEDALFCCLGSRWDLRVASLELARGTFMEKDAAHEKRIPPVCGFHALWRWNRPVAEKVIRRFLPDQS